MQAAQIHGRSHPAKLSRGTVRRVARTTQGGERWLELSRPVDQGLERVSEPLLFRRQELREAANRDGSERAIPRDLCVSHRDQRCGGVRRLSRVGKQSGSALAETFSRQVKIDRLKLLHHLQ